MKILVIGSGGREHALVWKINQSPKVSKIYCAPGNAGISQLAQCINIYPDKIMELADFAQKTKIDLTVVGPELSLSMGIVDEFTKRGLKIFGPTKMATEIESSKVFSKYMMKKYHIPTADYYTFTDHKEALAYIEKKEFPLVLKADGLAAGKGVFIVHNIKEAETSLDSLMNEKIFGDAGLQVIVEDYLDGEEVSVLAFSDGQKVVPMVSSQDHKKIYDNDLGPNTGGMGAYSPVPFYDENSKNKVLEDVLKPIIAGLKKEGREYKGVIYAGLVFTKNGIKVLEFNARFGDPETQVLLPGLETDIVEIFMAVIEGQLPKINIKWNNKPTVCVIAASGGYPAKYQKGKRISGLETLENKNDIYVFHAGTKFQKEEIVTSGGRVLGITAWAENINEAKKKAYEGIEKIYFEDIYYRKDIALKAIK
ncbi:MAG: phosphoribosylamine--glycine ligase [Candidatus Caldatribacteriota bacterium]|nr:phosphoribosylamine--glycine ligase [Candidatus Caldatribacteriota bacterium]